MRTRCISAAFIGGNDGDMIKTRLIAFGDVTEFLGYATSESAWIADNILRAQTHVSK
jgi:hypothetical protein